MTLVKALVIRMVGDLSDVFGLDLSSEFRPVVVWIWLEFILGCAIGFWGGAL